MRRVLMLLFPLAVIGAVFAVAFMSAGELSAPRETASSVAGEVTVEGAVLPASGVGQSPALTVGSGLLAPTLTLQDLDGAPVTVGSGSGVAQVVLFLAHWCPACQQEVPSLVRVLSESGVPSGVEVVAVLTGFDPSRPNWPPAAWLDREGLRPGVYGEGVVRVVRDDAEGSAMVAFGLSSYPGWAVVAPSGEVSGRFSGVVDRQGIAGLLEAVSALR